jgi:hypothetical protein
MLHLLIQNHPNPYNINDHIHESGLRSVSTKATQFRPLALPYNKLSAYIIKKGNPRRCSRKQLKSKVIVFNRIIAMT